MHATYQSNHFDPPFGVDRSVINPNLLLILNIFNLGPAVCTMGLEKNLRFTDDEKPNIRLRVQNWVRGGKISALIIETLMARFEKRTDGTKSV